MKFSVIELDNRENPPEWDEPAPGREFRVPAMTSAKAVFAALNQAEEFIQRRRHRSRSEDIHEGVSL